MKQKDNIISFTTYAKVDKANNVELSVTDLHRDTKFDIRGKRLIDELDSADEYETTEKLGLMELADRFSKVGHYPFTVEFKKQNGELRKIRGRMVQVENGLGRSHVIDFDIDKDPSKDYDNRMRQVDHRTIQSLIVNKVKYIKK